MAHVRRHITAQVAQCSATRLDAATLFGRSRFDVITMWYVIEHFDSLLPVLQKCVALLPIGGLFALSTPNSAALPFRVDRTAALHSSPIDHYTLWRARRAPAQLARFGLRVVRIVTHGVHSRQYPNMPAAVSRLLCTRFRQGTTFSIYARKIRER